MHSFRWGWAHGPIDNTHCQTSPSYMAGMCSSSPFKQEARWEHGDLLLPVLGQPAREHKHKQPCPHMQHRVFDGEANRALQSTTKHASMQPLCDGDITTPCNRRWSGQYSAATVQQYMVQQYDVSQGFIRYTRGPCTVLADSQHQVEHALLKVPVIAEPAHVLVALQSVPPIGKEGGQLGCHPEHHHTRVHHVLVIPCVVT